MNGLVDNREWKVNNLDQNEELDSVELIKTDGSSCSINNGGLEKRFGATAFFVKDKVTQLAFLSIKCNLVVGYHSFSGLQY